LKKRQLPIILLLAVSVLILLASCAKPPVAELNETRRIVAYAYASGALDLGGEMYPLATAALQAAEEQIAQHRYDEALDSLALARSYSNKALSLTVKRKQQLEQQRQERIAAEKKRREDEKKRNETLRKLRKELEEKQKVVVKKTVIPIAPKAPEKPELLDRVSVGPTDNLMLIAAKPEVYSDGALWPLIYKANRDQIKDPKEIFLGQELVIPRDKSDEEIAAARKEAEELNLF